MICADWIDAVSHLGFPQNGHKIYVHKLSESDWTVTTLLRVAWAANGYDVSNNVKTPQVDGDDVIQIEELGPSSTEGTTTIKLHQQVSPILYGDIRRIPINVTAPSATLHGALSPKRLWVLVLFFLLGPSGNLPFVL